MDLLPEIDIDHNDPTILNASLQLSSSTAPAASESRLGMLLGMLWDAGDEGSKDSAAAKIVQQQQRY